MNVINLRALYWKLTLTTPWPTLAEGLLTAAILALLIHGKLDFARPLPEISVTAGTLLFIWSWCANRLYHRNPTCTKCGLDKTECRHSAYP